MTAALDSLFNSPPGPSRPPPPLSPRSPSRTPSPRRDRAGAGAQFSEPLFLSPGDNQTPQRPRPAPITFEPETDPFEEFENRYRAAAAGGRGEESVPTAALGAYDPLAALDGGGDDEEGPAKKKRKPIPKIDADRLMGSAGLPALMREAKRFKVKGKGHETADLKALLEVYQIWAHRMFPRGDFMGTMTRVENVLRTRRMENAMKGYREAFHPPPARSTSPHALGNGALTPPLDDDDVEAAAAAEADRDGDEGSQGAGARPGPLFDDVDLDEMAAVEEMEREAAAGSRRAMSTDGSEPPLLDEEDEWEGLYD